MMILNQNHVDAPVVVLPRVRSWQVDGASSLHNMSQVWNVAPLQVGTTGEDRLQANIGSTTGIHAHAAVRMHAFPVPASFWAYCPKTETGHSQRLKVAT